MRHRTEVVTGKSLAWDRASLPRAAWPFQSINGGGISHFEAHMCVYAGLASNIVL